MKHPAPEREGHYWAKLRLADNPDHNSSDWEVVQVYDNILRPWCEADIESGECMFVHVPGIRESQPIDAFVWGPEVPRPSPNPPPADAMKVATAALERIRDDTGVCGAIAAQALATLKGQGHG